MAAPLNALSGFGPGPSDASVGVRDDGGGRTSGPAAALLGRHPKPVLGRSAQSRLERRQTGLDGDLEGHFLDRITFGAVVVCRNAFPGPRLSDDEIAIATVLARMATFVREGTPFYGLADAAHDAYMALLIHEAAVSGRAIDSERQPWSDAPSLPHGAATLSP